MSFDVEIGHASERGPRERNDDFAGALRAAPHEAQRGFIAAVADGVSAGAFGYEAAQTTVRTLLDDFFAVPETWEVTVALDRLIGAHNEWLASANRRRKSGAAMTTLTAIVLQGHTWTLAHVGDTRCWLLRKAADGSDELAQLSQDHNFEHPDMSSRLTRAVGLDDFVRVDYLQGDLHAGDTFVLTSDGVHGFLKRHQILRLARAGAAEEGARTLVRAALDAGSTDNATALVVHVRGLDAATLDDAMRHARQLAVPGKLKVGDSLDGYTVTALVADNGVHRILQARAPAVQPGAARELVALKTLSEGRASDPEERAMLAHEAWLASRITSSDASGFVAAREPMHPSAFYLVYDWVPGTTLEQHARGGRRFSVAEVVDGATQIARALGRLHRQGVVHRDIKPANLYLGDDGAWRIIDLGAAVSGREPKVLRVLHAGTPSYMNPEQWDDPPAAADAGSDLFALGVTMYQWLTGALPYGEIEPYQRARYRRDPVAPSRRRPDVPIWLDHVILKAIALDRRQRFETAEELRLALERGAARPIPAPPPTPLAARDPLLLWQIAFVISALFNALLVVWLLFLPT